MKVVVLSCPLNNTVDQDIALRQAVAALLNCLEGLPSDPALLNLIDIPDDTKSYMVKVEPVK